MDFRFARLKERFQQHQRLMEETQAEIKELYQFALTLLQMKLANTRRMTSDV